MPDRDLLPEGLEDRLPQDAAAAARVTRAVLDVLDGHGYDRVQPPSIEFETSMASRMAGVQPRRMFRRYVIEGPAIFGWFVRTEVFGR